MTKSDELKEAIEWAHGTLTEHTGDTSHMDILEQAARSLYIITKWKDHPIVIKKILMDDGWV